MSEPATGPALDPAEAEAEARLRARAAALGIALAPERVRPILAGARYLADAVRLLRAEPGAEPDRP